MSLDSAIENNRQEERKVPYKDIARNIISQATAIQGHERNMLYKIIKSVCEDFGVSIPNKGEILNYSQLARYIRANAYPDYWNREVENFYADCCSNPQQRIPA